MIILPDTKRAIELDPQHWYVPLMDFVDDFRYRRDPSAVAEPFALTDEHTDALLAATARFYPVETEHLQ